MRFSSVRVRLTLWNVSVLAAVLIGFGVAASYSVRHALTVGVDQGLTRRARFYSERWSRFDRFRQPGSFPGGSPPPAGAISGGRPPGPEPRRSSEADRRGFFRQLRLLGPDGRPLNPYSSDEAWDLDAVYVALGGKEIFSTTTFDGEPIRVISEPLWRNGEVEAVVQFAHSLTEQNRLIDGLSRTLLTLIPLALLAAGIGGAFLTDRALRPVRRITQAAGEISAEDLSRRLEVTGNDELAEMASTFNGMIARLEEAFHRLENAYEQQRRFTGDASHELRTPLTTIKANTSLMLSGVWSAEDYREALRATDAAADTMRRIVNDLLLLARSDSGHLGLELRPEGLDRIIDGAAAAVRDPENAPVRIELPDPPPVVMADAHHLGRLFVNLLENAVRHTPTSGQVTVSARVEGDTVHVRVEDTGEGIPPEHLPHVCERFYRVDAARARAGHTRGGGTGLGLAICQSIVQAHGGTLAIDSEGGRGTAVTVSIPLASAADDAARAPGETENAVH